MVHRGVVQVGGHGEREDRAQMLRLLDRIAAGTGTDQDVATIRRLANAMEKASLCGLGQGAPNPVLSALRYFEPEFRGRLVAGRN